jgi:hypothetical protein
MVCGKRGEKEMNLYVRCHRSGCRTLRGFSQVRSANKWSLETGISFPVSCRLPHLHRSSTCPSSFAQHLLSSFLHSFTFPLSYVVSPFLIYRTNFFSCPGRSPSSFVPLFSASSLASALSLKSWWKSHAPATRLIPLLSL